MNELAKAIKEWAETKGWDSKVNNPTDFGEKIALMHSELSEALEEFRAGRKCSEIYFHNLDTEKKHDDTYNFEQNPTQNKPEGIPIELADCIIRILHFCACNDIDIDEAIDIKMKYNWTREYRHGGKLA